MQQALTQINGVYGKLTEIDALYAQLSNLLALGEPYTADEKTKVAALKTSKEIAALTDYADDAAAAVGGVAVGDWYRTGSVPKVRIA